LKKLFGRFRKKKSWGNEVMLPEMERSHDENTKHMAEADQVDPVNDLLACASSQSIGLQREKNEDSLFKICASINSDGQLIPFGIFVVADGMGGHQHGELASAAAVEKFIEITVKEVYGPELREETLKPVDELEEIVGGAVRKANQHVYDQAPGGGTTLTAAVIHGNSVTIAHIGDSRAYLYTPERKLTLMTSDHSLVNKLVEIGQITKRQAETHPQRNILLRALGNDINPEVDVCTREFPENCAILLCSDGMWGVVPEQKIVEILDTTPFLPEACKKLVDAANNLGGPDNISVILVKHS